MAVAALLLAAALPCAPAAAQYAPIILGAPVSAPPAPPGPYFPSPGAAAAPPEAWQAPVIRILPAPAPDPDPSLAPDPPLAFAPQPQPGPQAPPDPELRQALIDAVNTAESFADRYTAQVWLGDMSKRLERFMPYEDERLEFLRLLHAEAHKASLPPELVLAVIDVESRFDRFAISYAGAQGYMQVMPFWLKEIGRPEDNLFHVKTNLRFGCTILRFYLDKENGQVVPALARYNGSIGRPGYPYLVLNALNQRWNRN